MTEAEWWAATDPDKLIDWLFFDAWASDRKLRLFATACCRRVEFRLTMPEFLAALRSVELFADGAVSGSEVATVRHRAVRAFQDRWGGMPTATAEADASRAVISAMSEANDTRQPFFRSRGWYESEDNFPYPCWAAYGAADSTVDDDSVSTQAEGREQAAQSHLLHDIFGPLPFRDVAVAPAWLTSDVLALARGIYDEKAFDRMPILADALQDAGCDNDEILSHCRATQWEHVRGCWVIDLLLGKPWREERPAPG